jgi:glycogen debranching enzyme
MLNCQLEPGGVHNIYLSIGCNIDDQPALLVTYDDALEQHRSMLEARSRAQAEVYTTNEQFNDWLNRSGADLRMLTSKTEVGEYPYAGIPWFSTVFGRDALITALQNLWLNPQLARGVLAFLAEHQAQTEDPSCDAEPGKILHEMRGGEMAALGEVPFACYYGSVDSTPLFVWLAGAYYRRWGDLDFIQSIWPNICMALKWIDRYGDSDGDGFVEYSRHSVNGLVQQGWKDSDDSIFHEDGTPADCPIALCEVQGYVYQAKLQAAQIAHLLGEDRHGDELERQAETLKLNFNQAFWCEDIQTFALALDGAKRPCQVRSSNAGHVLATGIADAELARDTAHTLMNPSSFNGWGVRTIAEGEARYNPMSYHNGSIWPHDSAMVAAGLARYGDRKHAMDIMTGLFNASIKLDLQRLPELFCGFDKLRGQGPTLYPVACVPQAWSSGAVFQLLQSCLGMTFSAEKPQLSFHHPVLPDYLHHLEIKNLQFANGVLDLAFFRHPRDVGVNVLRKEGDIEIAVIV